MPRLLTPSIAEICLIIPPSPFLEDSKRNCPLGILYVAAALEQSSYRVQVADLRNGQASIPEASIYGITATSAEYPYAREIAQIIWCQWPSTRIVIGGCHATFAPDECVDDGFLVVRGEGERAVVSLLDNMPPNHIGIDDLDSLPYPARHLLPHTSLVSTTLCHWGIPATTIIASRGCPFNCTYCASPRITHRRVRQRSPKSVMAEASLLAKEYGVQELRFQDDELNLSRAWLAEFKCPLPFRCNARAELGNWSELRKAGCYEVGIGVETAKPKAHRLHKGVDLESTRRGIIDAWNNGLEVRLFFIIGLPFDAGDISNRTIDFLESLHIPLTSVLFNLFSPFPGSDIGEHPQKYGITIVEPPKSFFCNVGPPRFSFTSKDVNLDEVLMHYNTLKSYARSKRWVK